MSRGPDAATLLERALVAAGHEAGVEVEVLASEWQRWASATFIGARHRLTLCAARSPSLNLWLAGLPEHEFRLSGQLVADLIVAGTRRTGERVEMDLEVLTVEDC
jgi:hypothetical protein